MIALSSMSIMDLGTRKILEETPHKRKKGLKHQIWRSTQTNITTKSPLNITNLSTTWIVYIETHRHGSLSSDELKIDNFGNKSNTLPVLAVHTIYVCVRAYVRGGRNN